MGKNIAMEVMKCFVKAIKEILRPNIWGSHMRWNWEAVQNQWSLGISKYVYKFGLYALSMEKLSNSLAKAISK
jgi:hypothetical protein